MLTHASEECLVSIGIFYIQNVQYLCKTPVVDQVLRLLSDRIMGINTDVDTGFMHDI